jgi:seryl-tRNA synthetase
MLDINWIRANAAAVDAALRERRNVPFSASELIALDDARKAVITRLEEAQASRNSLSKQIGQAKAQKDEARAQALLEEVGKLNDSIQAGAASRRTAE